MESHKIGLPAWLIEMLEKNRDKELKFDNIFERLSNPKIIEVRHNSILGIQKVNEYKRIKKSQNPIIEAKYNTGLYTFNPHTSEILIQ
jgi:hypothetical protein